MPWWSWIPSMRPLKGFSNFLYIFTHWDSISEDQKKRDERLQAVEELTSQMLRLKEQAHAEEKRALERELQNWREAFEHVASYREQIGLAIKEIEQSRKLIPKLWDDLYDAAGSLALMLHFETDQEWRARIFSQLSPQLQKLMDRHFSQIAEAEAKLRDRGTTTEPSALPPPSGLPPKSAGP